MCASSLKVPYVKHTQSELNRNIVEGESIQGKNFHSVFTQLHVQAVECTKLGVGEKMSVPNVHFLESRREEIKGKTINL